MSVYHCPNCQKRSGSSFAAQARWPEEAVHWSGEYRCWLAVGKSGGRATFLFLSRVRLHRRYQAERLPVLTAIAVGAFADPDFPPPVYSVYEERKQAWVDIVGEGIEHHD